VKHGRQGSHQIVYALSIFIGPSSFGYIRTTSFHKTIKGKGKEVRIYVTNMSLIFVSIPLIVEPHWTLSLQF